MQGYWKVTVPTLNDPFPLSDSTLTIIAFWTDPPPPTVMFVTVKWNCVRPSTGWLNDCSPPVLISKTIVLPTLTVICAPSASGLPRSSPTTRVKSLVPPGAMVALLGVTTGVPSGPDIVTETVPNTRMLLSHTPDVPWVSQMPSFAP